MTKYPDLRYERKLWRSGVEAVAGVDEAGVGPMAGPVVAAAPYPPAGGSAVRRRGVLAAGRPAVAGPGHEHRAPGRADRHRGGTVEPVRRAVVTPDPQLPAGGTIGSVDPEPNRLGCRSAIEIVFVTVTFGAIRHLPSPRAAPEALARSAVRHRRRFSAEPMVSG